MSNYICNPDYNQERLPDTAYAKAKKITDKWEPIQRNLETCGNVRPTFNTKTNRFGFSHELSFKEDSQYVGMYNVISSALLFYRLFCLWAFTWNVCDGEGAQRYKCIWWLTLRHKDTGEILQFGEWKGAAGIWTRFHRHQELPATYKKDLLELMNFIVSNKVPHPYDGCVAGSVA